MKGWAFLVLLAGCGASPPAPEPEIREVELDVPGTSIRMNLIYVGGKPGLRPFFISRNLVTWGEFDRFYEFPEEERVDGVTRPSSGKNYLGLSGLDADLMLPARPVVGLRYHSAIQFCEWLSKRTGRQFRLPTESEWELACPPGRSPSRLADLSKGIWEYCLEPDRPPDFAPVLRQVDGQNPRAPRRRLIPPEWEEADPNRPFSTWWFRTDFSQGFRVVEIPRESGVPTSPDYPKKIQVLGLRGQERNIKVGTSVHLLCRVTGEVQNAGDRSLTELLLKVYFLDPRGKPHVEDVTSNLTRRATFNICAPVLSSSAHPGPHSLPLRPGERRSFAVDLPMTLDAESDVQIDAFGASVLSFRFDQEPR